MFKKLVPGVCGLALTALASTADAALITDASALDNPVVVDFSQFSGTFAFTAGPVDIGGLVGEAVSWQTGNPNSVLGNGSYGLGANGQWNAGRSGFAGLNAPVGMMDFLLETATTGIGGFVNYIAQIATVVEIAALDINGDVLESHDLMIEAPVTPAGDNGGGFRGITRASAEIYGLRITNAYVVLDDLSFSRPIEEMRVGEPGALALFGLGIAGLGWSRRRAA